MTKQIVHTEKAPAALGPYSQAVIANGFVYTSGQLGLVPETGELRDTLEDQTRQVFQNIRAVLVEAGSNLDKIVKTTIFLQNMHDFAAVNAIYAEYFKGDFPARSTVEVAALPKGGLVEIETIALV